MSSFTPKGSGQQLSVRQTDIVIAGLLTGFAGGDIFLLLFFLTLSFFMHFLKCYVYIFILLYFYK